MQESILIRKEKKVMIIYSSCGLSSSYVASLYLVFFFISGVVGVGLFRSSVLLIFNMVWPCIFCGTVFVCLQSPYHDNDMIFWIVTFVQGHAFCEEISKLAEFVESAGRSGL